jgi:hypothetical protein
MTVQVVNTDGISSTIAKLRTANNNINKEYDILENNAVQLDSNWQSQAGQAARDTMYGLFQYSEVRSAVLLNCINFLEQQINPSYIYVEDFNTKLADKFK